MSTSTKRAIALMLAIVVAVGLGIGLGFILDSGPSHLDVISETPSGPGPRDEVNGVPVGYARTEEGAVAAATNLALLTGRNEFLDPSKLSAAMQSVATPSWRATAARQAKEGVDYILKTYGLDADISSAVLRYEVEDFTGETAAVRLWTVSVAAGSKRRLVEEVWSVLRFDLRWLEDDWHVAGLRSESGPAPVGLPAGVSDSSATSIMESLEEFSGAPSP